MEKKAIGQDACLKDLSEVLPDIVKAKLQESYRGEFKRYNSKSAWGLFGAFLRSPYLGLFLADVSTPDYRKRIRRDPVSAMFEIRGQLHQDLAQIHLERLCRPQGLVVVDSGQTLNCFKSQSKDKRMAMYALRLSSLKEFRVPDALVTTNPLDGEVKVVKMAEVSLNSGEGANGLSYWEFKARNFLTLKYHERFANYCSGAKLVCVVPRDVSLEFDPLLKDEIDKPINMPYSYSRFNRFLAGLALTKVPHILQAVLLHGRRVRDD